MRVKTNIISKNVRNLCCWVFFFQIKKHRSWIHDIGRWRAWYLCAKCLRYVKQKKTTLYYLCQEDIISYSKALDMLFLLRYVPPELNGNWRMKKHWTQILFSCLSKLVAIFFTLLSNQCIFHMFFFSPYVLFSRCHKVESRGRTERFAIQPSQMSTCIRREQKWNLLCSMYA